MPKATKPPKTAKAKPPAPANGAVQAENMTLSEAAAWFRVPEEGLRGDAAAGRVPARLVAGEWRFNKPALVAWMSQPEPQSALPKTGAELVEHIRRINPGLTYAENPEAVEAEIAELYKLRKTMWG